MLSLKSCENLIKIDENQTEYQYWCAECDEKAIFVVGEIDLQSNIWRQMCLFLHS